MNPTNASPLTALKAIYQEPSRLILGIAYSHLPCQLTILKQELLTVGQWRFMFHIIGESHFVQVEYDKQLVLQELLACIDLDPAYCSHYHDFGNLNIHRYSHSGYSVNVDFKSRDKGYTLPNGLAMEVAFPAIYGTVPVTQIRWQVTRDKVRWWTHHLYPQEAGVVEVRTQTGFNLTARYKHGEHN
jgi:hypothetical protein